MAASETQPDFGTELQHVAVRSFLSTVVAISECLAEICPEVGLAFRNRWRRLPQRLAFDLSARELEASRQAFERDIQTFGRFTKQYLNDGLPMIAAIASTGSQMIEAVLERSESHSVLLETLADSIDSVSDLGDIDEIRQTLEFQSAGLRSCARQADTELIPLITRLRDMVRECERILSDTRDSVVVDERSGFLNAAGFLEHLQADFEDGRKIGCLVLIDFDVAAADGEDCTDEDFSVVVGPLAARITEQFRPTDSIGRHGRKFAVIFAGRIDQAANRMESIKRSISGGYFAGARRVKLTARMRLEAAASIAAVREFFELPALPATEPETVAEVTVASFAPLLADKPSAAAPTEAVAAKAEERSTAEEAPSSEVAEVAASAADAPSEPAVESDEDLQANHDSLETASEVVETGSPETEAPIAAGSVVKEAVEAEIIAIDVAASAVPELHRVDETLVSEVPVSGAVQTVELPEAVVEPALPEVPSSSTPAPQPVEEVPAVSRVPQVPEAVTVRTEEVPDALAENDLSEIPAATEAGQTQVEVTPVEPSSTETPHAGAVEPLHFTEAGATPSTNGLAELAQAATGEGTEPQGHDVAPPVQDQSAVPAGQHEASLHPAVAQ